MARKSIYKKEEIIKELVRLRLEEKYSMTTLLQLIQDKYNYKIAAAYNILREVNNYISNIYKENHKEILERQVADLENQRELAKKEKNNKLVLEITKEINKIYGLHSEKLDITGKIETEVKIIKLVKKINDED